MPLFRSKAEQKLVERGLDPARLPPGQYLTEKWPVLHAGSEPLLLEEREVAPRPRAAHDRPARLLGAVRVPQRCGLLEGRALRLLGQASNIRSSSNEGETTCRSS